MRFDLDTEIMLEMREFFFSKLYDNTLINEYNEVFKVVKEYDENEDEYTKRWIGFAFVTTYDRKSKSIARIQVRTSVKNLMAFNEMLKNRQDWDIRKYFKDNFRM